MAYEAETLELEPRRHTLSGLAIAVGVTLLLLSRVGLADSDDPAARPVPAMTGPAAAALPARATGQTVTIAPQCAAETSRAALESCRRALSDLLASLAAPGTLRTCRVGADAAEHWVRSAGRLLGCRTGGR